jgi:protein SCO1/2
MRSRPRSRSERRAWAPRRALLRLLPLLLAAATASAAEPEQLRAGAFDPPRAAPAFSLRGSDGAELTLERYRGKVVILYFGFTSCPNVCPTTLGVLAKARKQLGAAADGVQVVYVTVDPERDDAERLRGYLANFDPTFVGGTGSAEQLAAVRDEYGIAATRTTLGAGYGYSHSSYTYLVDREGRLRALMPYGRSPEDYVHDLEILLGP